jgi:hypothetical protein
MSIYKKNTSPFPIAQRASFAVTPRTPATLLHTGFLKFTSSFLQSTSYKFASSNLTSAPLALNRSHLPPVTYFLNRSIILHITHTLFCREVHNSSSRSRCCLASKRTINLRAILLLYVHYLYLDYVNNCKMLSYKLQSSKYRLTVKTIKISISNTQLILNRVMYTTYFWIMSKTVTF